MKCGKELSEGAGFCTSCGTSTGRTGEPAVGVPGPVESSFPEGPLPPAPPPEREFLEAPGRRVSIPLLVALVVIVLLVVASAVIAPAILVYTSAKRESERRTCQSNLRNIESAIEMYGVTSSDETYPSSLEDMASPEIRVLKSIPTCPSGSKQYIWVEGDIGKPPSVSCPNRSDHTI